MTAPGTSDFLIDPPIAAGDFKVSKDGGALANLTTLPAVSPAGSRGVVYVLSATEMTADNVRIEGHDPDGEWADVFIPLRPLTPAASLDAAGVRAAIGLASANLDTQLAAAATITAAAIRSALGLAGANLDTQLAALAAFIDTEIASILTQTAATAIRSALGLASANLDTQLAAAVTITAAAIRSALGVGSANLDAQLSAIAGYIDTEVAAIKAKTDGLPSDPADASDIAAAFSSVSVTLAALGVAVADKTGYRLSAAGVDDILDEIIEGATTLRQSMRLANTANAAKLSGAATATQRLRDLADTKDRIVVTTDADGNRTAVTRDVT